jgi:hypothetical protein
MKLLTPASGSSRVHKAGIPELQNIMMPLNILADSANYSGICRNS